MSIRICALFFVVLFSVSLLFPAGGSAAVLSGNTVWQGKVLLQEDVLVPQGVTLTIRPGTSVRVAAAVDTKIAPEYLSRRTEITVRGILRIEGSDSSPVSLAPANPSSSPQWAGIIVDGGQVVIDRAEISGAETALYVLNGKAELTQTSLHDNRYGVIGQGGGSEIKLNRSSIKDNDYGLYAFSGAKIVRRKTVISGNRSKDRGSATTREVHFAKPSYQLPPQPISRSYKSGALQGQIVWSGKVLVDGIVRVPPAARLIILPGTVVEFTMHDSNGDGIGENGLMIQGQLIAKGMPDKPIIFRSAESVEKKGAWDAINILGSDHTQNLIEYCQIEDAYRGMHFHFANVAVDHAILTNNYRGLQFQESLVSVRDSFFYDNNSAIQARDSQVVFSHNRIFDNINGVNFFRLDLRAEHNLFAANRIGGLRIREGAARIRHNLMAGNRFGLLVVGAVYGNFSDNLITDNLESGISLRRTDNITVSGNIVEANGVNGFSLREAGGKISGNLIAENGERGIGVRSFSGLITANNFVANGSYAIGLEGEGDVDAPANWWGGGDLARKLYDRHDQKGLGEIRHQHEASRPFCIVWPVADLAYDATMRAKIAVDRTITVHKGATLTIKPGTTLYFGKNTGLEIFGCLNAVGDRRRIRFTSEAQSGPGDWGEIRLQHADNSRIENCDFEYANWGLHIHFVAMEIKGCRFLHNYGGMRFRSGPYEIDNSLFAHNRIGIRTYLATANIHHDEIRDNAIGIFIREKGGGITLHDNNIFANKRYDLELGDFNQEDVDAQHNWWGKGDLLPLLFDARREKGIGTVLFEPAAKKPFPFRLKE